MIGLEESGQRQPTMPSCQLKCHLTPAPEAATGTRKPARCNGLALTTTADKYSSSDRCSMLFSSVMWIIYGKKCVIFSKSLLSVNAESSIASLFAVFYLSPFCLSAFYQEGRFLGADPSASLSEGIKERRGEIASMKDKPRFPRPEKNARRRLCVKSWTAFHL